MARNLTIQSIAATGTARQWRFRVVVEEDGQTTSHNLLFPDDMQTWQSQGFFTAQELQDQMLEVVLWAARKRSGKP